MKRNWGNVWLAAAASLALVTVGCGEKKMSSAARTPAAPAAGEASRAVNVAETSPVGQQRIAREVHHQLVLLPYYGVFDNLAYRVDGDTVTLLGQVTRPTLKSDAQNVVKNIEGVERVVNNIEVLPLSSTDDRIRLAEYRAIYSEPSLQKYGLQAVPPIHIIVNNGNVTLVGVVANQTDKNLADIRAKGVPGVFSVTDNLRVEQ